mmetsp:Transcript_99472/g.191032  ORF Transcript_99472/g.191032 Transcript_99472/m.191032 type:complete len:341 (+) Transcript_99472:156-1178(+)
MATFRGLILGSMLACSAAAAGLAAQTGSLDCETLQFGEDCDVSSLMQTDRVSVMPGINERVSDSFEMADEYDAHMPVGSSDTLKVSLAAQVAQVSLPDHFSDARFYIMTLTYALCFAIVAELFKRWQSQGMEASEDEEELINTESFFIGGKQSIEKPAVDNAPIFDLGGSADFDALAEAVRSQDESRCLQLVKARHAARKEDACGSTALHIAAQCGSSAMAKILIEHGAKVNARTAWDETPLHIAAREGSAEVCQLLLEHGAEINAADANSQTPVLAAALAGKEAACEMLLAKDAGVHGTADSELPPLLNSLLFRRMFIGATPKEVFETDAVDTIDEDGF